MKLIEEEMLLNYSYAGTVRITNKNGSVHSKTAAESNGYIYDFKPKNFADADQACQAYIDLSSPVERGIGSVTFTVAGTQIVIPDRGLPPYMDSVV